MKTIEDQQPSFDSGKIDQPKAPQVQSYLLSTLRRLKFSRRKNAPLISHSMTVWLLLILSVAAPGTGLSQAGKTYIVNTLGDEEDPDVGMPGEDGKCDVDLNTPGDQCPFRAAIQNHNFTRLVNGSPVRNQIVFNIDLQQQGASTPTIQVGSTGNGPLPFVLGIVTIDGTTQLNPAGNSAMIELDGSQAGTFASGLELRAGGGDFHALGEGSIVRGLVIHSFASNGIAIGGTGTPGLGGHVIEGCFIGTDLQGKTVLANGGDGIHIEDTPNNTIGGDTPEKRNVISGNLGNGIRIEDTFQFTADNLAKGNRVVGNFVGVDVEGITNLGNVGDGVHIINASDNIIGGFRLSEGNLVGGNQGNGIRIIGEKAKNHIIEGNDIGFNPRADMVLPNTGDGIHILNASDNTIGGLRDQFMVTLRGNLISGNMKNGIYIEGANAKNNKILGNHIGTSLSGAIIGNEAHPNQENGIYILNAPSNTIGEIFDEGRNLISGNLGNGVHIEGSEANDNKILGNFIGTNSDGNNRLGNKEGVLISNASNNTIGGPIIVESGEAPGNLISGNRDNGIQISGSTAKNNNVEGNIIGLNKAGNAALGNGMAGVFINDASQITIGGRTDLGLKQNVISGNLDDGVNILGINAQSNKIQNNLIGTDISGSNIDPTPDAPNSGDELGNRGDGIHIVDAPNNTIGGITLPFNEGNIIAGNGDNGVNIQGAAAIDNNIRGNHIGTNTTGKLLPDGKDGILINGARNTLIGGTALERNIISGNKGDGIEIGPGARDNFIFNNLIGLVPGVILIGEALPNDSFGIFINNASNNIIGGFFLSPGGVVPGPNTISGNRGDGIHISGANAAGNIVQINRIGTDIPGLVALPNMNGIVINGAPNNTIGGDPNNDGNLISGNTLDGIHIQGVNAINNSIEGNTIGLDVNDNPLPNLDGVQITDAPNNSIGAIINRGNIIAGNSGNGVEIAGNGATGNPIRFNSTFGNAELGIDLASDDVTTNDLGDADAGPNNLQNFPVLTSAFSPPVIPGGPPPRTTITGSFNSTSNTAFTLDFYINITLDPSGFGEGEQFLGSQLVITDESGNASFTFNFPRIPPGLIVTATATDPNKNTSEFSKGITVEELIGQLADLEVKKKVDKPALFVGEQVAFTVTLTNKGPSDATGIQVTDAEPAGLAFDEITPGTGSYDTSTSIWTVDNLANGDSATLAITATAQQEGEITNTAEVTAVDQPDADSSPGNNDPSEDDQDSITIEVQPEGPVAALPGRISMEVWTDIPGRDISTIPFDSLPSSVSHLILFEAPENVGDNYGTRLRGYLVAPQTGNYTFWISSDDLGEVWISTDENPVNKKKIAEVQGWTNSREWDKYPAQRSAPVSLVTGRRYYVEALMKESFGRDHVAVGWQLPDGSFERPIPGIRVIPFESPRIPPPCTGTGFIQQEFWTNVTGRRVSAIPFDREPDFSRDLTIFESASGIADNYGSRIRGYVCPPLTGEYTFWIAGDDHTELWLGSDDNPDTKTKIAYHTGWTNSRHWTKSPTQQSPPVVLIANRRYDIEAIMKEATGADHVSVGWQLPDGTLERPIAGTHLIPFESPPTECAGTGTILVETWRGIDGPGVASIPVDSPPDLTGERTIFEVPTNIGSNFGSRVRGYICVPVTGNYTFWIASDDHSELWLSTDADPANKQRIANVWGWTTPRQWTKYTSQQSAPINLVAGRQYYIEALYKEDEGGDNMAVGWQLPDGMMERPIPGNRLSPFEDAARMTLAEASIQANTKTYSQISVYPNPARSGDRELTIAGYEGIEQTIETQVEIINMTGEVVFEELVSCGGNCGSYLMNINKQLVPGIYMVNMKTNGVRTSKRLLVK